MEDLKVIKIMIDKIADKANKTMSTTEKCKYIFALLSIEESVYEFSSTLSKHAHDKRFEIIKGWN